MINYLSLTISLRMVGCAEIELCALEGKKGLPKQTCKHFVSITDNCRWHAMEFEDIVHERLGHLHGCKRVSKGHKVHILGKSIHHNIDHSLPTRIR